MASPQPEPFVKFSKELFDAVLLSPMPATHKELVMAVIRRTYGDHGKKQAPISHSLLQRMTGRAESGVRRCLTALMSEGVIVQVLPPTFRQPAVLSLNKDYETWGRWSVQSATTVAERQKLADCHQGDRADRQTLAGGSATTVAEESATVVAPWKKEILEEQETRARARDPSPTPVENPTRQPALHAVPDDKPQADDAAWLQELGVDYPDVDLVLSIRACRDHWAGRQATKKANWRSRIRNWVANDAKWAKERAPAELPRAAPDLVRPEMVASLAAMVADGCRPEDLQAMCASDAEYAAVMAYKEPAKKAVAT